MEPLTRTYRVRLGKRASSAVFAAAFALASVATAGAVAAAAPKAKETTPNPQKAKAGKRKAAAVTEPKAASAPKPVAFDRRWLEPYFVSGPLAPAAEAFRRDDSRRAIALTRTGLSKLPFGSPERLPGKFMLALAYANADEWTAAGAIFEELYKKQPLMAAYHAYHAARCRLRRGDAEGALLWAGRVPEGAILEAESVLIRLDALASLGRQREVAEEAGRFLERFPHGPRRAEAMFRRAEALEASGVGSGGGSGGDIAQAAALYRRIWAEAPLEAWSRRAEERLAEIGQRPRPQGKVAQAGVGEDFAALAKFTASDWQTRGMELFDRNQNEDAEAAFTQALALSPAGPASAALRCKAEYHRAQSIFKQRQRPRAAPFFIKAEAACREAADGDLITKSLYQGARCLASGGNRDAALAKYAVIEKEAPAHSYADDARLRAAELHTSAERPAEAAALLAKLPDLYPAGDQAGEAMWRLALAAIQAKDLPTANKWLDENLRRIPRESIWYAEGRALYWKARVALLEDDKSAALGHYTRAIREYPLSVYTLLSLERMRVEFPEARRKLMRELRTNLVGAASKATWQFAPRVIFGSPEFRRAVELARMGIGSDARRELARINLTQPANRDAARAGSAPARDDDDDDKDGEDKAANRGKSAKASDSDDDGQDPGNGAVASGAKAGKPVGKTDNKSAGSAKAARKGESSSPADPEAEREDVVWITAILLDRGRSWAAAHAIPRYTLTAFRRDYPQGKREAQWRLAYPRAFAELVASNSRTNRVPEALQLAIMREESAFNPRIESFANALGLTQMLVKTAKRFTERNVSREMLMDPARNLEVGSRFLAFLLERYHRKAPLAIAGYNAGEGAVDRWLGERGDLALDEFLETIPYDETRNYTKRVLSSFLSYSWLYDSARPVPELTFSLKAPPRPERVGRPARPGAQRRPR